MLFNIMINNIIKACTVNLLCIIYIEGENKCNIVNQF